MAHKFQEMLFTTFEVTECCVCGVKFGVPEMRLRQSRDKQADLYCPNGHCLTWKESENDRLKKRLHRAEEEANHQAELRRRAEEERDHTERRRRAAVGQNTKLKNRVKNGVCPCCQRTFKNLARHMESQHPDYAPEDE